MVECRTLRLQDRGEAPGTGWSGGVKSPQVAGGEGETISRDCVTEGFVRPEIRCQLPGLGTMVGYAVTARTAEKLPEACRKERLGEFDSIDCVRSPDFSNEEYRKLLLKEFGR